MKSPQPSAVSSRLCAVFVLLPAILLSNCTGNIGGIEPAGKEVISTVTHAIQEETAFVEKVTSQTFENGFIKGTVKGIRKDGRPFKENFNFTLADQKESFSSVKNNSSSGTAQALSLYRSQCLEDHSRNENNTYIQLIIENKGQPNQKAKLTDFNIDLVKLLPDQDFFVFKSYAVFSPDESVTLPVSRANNTRYQLSDFGRKGEFVYDDKAEKTYLIFPAQEGKRVCFEQQNVKGNLYKFAFVMNSEGKPVTSDVYNGLMVQNDEFVSNFVFSTSSGKPLSETIAVPADRQQVKNFVYNPATGLLTFDYTIHIEAFRGENISQHPVEITGSVRATVYNNLLNNSLLSARTE